MTNKTGKGGFKKGTSGNPKGRSPRKTEAAYLNAMIGAITMADWVRVVKKAVDDAKMGDAKARQWLGDYLIGKPSQVLEHTGENGAPIDLFVTVESLED